jgi:DNA invertase Pin-like site-specific DNA recombinase
MGLTLKNVENTIEVMNCVAYYRVSDVKQERSGLGIDAQKDAVRRFIANPRPNQTRTLIAEFEETGSGRKAKRNPKLEEALALCKKKKALLVIAKLDRLARNVAFVSTLMESTTKFVALDLPDTVDPLHTHIYAAFAEHEARRISQRIRDALKEARKRGSKLGGHRYLRNWDAPKDKVEYLRDPRGRRIKWDPRKATAAGRAARTDNFEKRQAQLALTVQSLRDKKMTLTAIGAELKKLGHHAPRGGEWYPAQVARLLPKPKKKR